MRALVGLLERGGLAALDRLVLADDKALLAVGVEDHRHRHAIQAIREVLAVASNPSEASASASLPSDAVIVAAKPSAASAAASTPFQSFAGASMLLEAAVAVPRRFSEDQVSHGFNYKTHPGAANKSNRYESAYVGDQSSAKRSCTHVHRHAVKFISTGVSKDTTGSKWLANVTVAAGDKPTLLGIYGNQAEAEQAISRTVQLASTGKSLDEILEDAKNTQPDRIRFSSRFAGVSWNRLSCNWQVQIKVDGKVVHFGTFKDEGEAGETANFARTSLDKGVSVTLIKKLIKEKKFRL